MHPALLAYLGLTRLLAPVLLRHAAAATPPDRRAERWGTPSMAPRAGALWVSAASVGELRAVAPLLPGLCDVLVTTQTQSAAVLCAELGLLHQFSPVDAPRAVGAFLDAWQPRAAVFVESELPPRMIRALTRSGVPLALIGARPSRTRSRFPRAMAELLAPFSIITAATEAVAEELRALGLGVDIVEDLKSAALAPALPGSALEAWADMGSRPIWLAASTHAGEEAAVLAAHDTLRRTHPNALLILAPRHTERATEVAALVANAPPSRQSRGELPGGAVHLVDTMGDLPLFYALAPVTFLGGSLVAKGGHSPYEPALYGSHVLTGSHIANHRAGFAAIPNRVVTAQDLAEAVAAAWQTPRPAPWQPQEAARTRAALLTL